MNKRQNKMMKAIFKNLDGDKVEISEDRGNYE